MKTALYAKIPAELHVQLRHVAVEARLPLAEVVETIVAVQLGHDHPRASIVRDAIDALRIDVVRKARQ